MELKRFFTFITSFSFVFGLFWGYQASSDTLIKGKQIIYQSPFETLDYKKEDKCPQTKLVNKTNEPWNNTDKLSLKTAQTGCKRHGYSPCLKTFIKVKTRTYQAWCGKAI